MAEPPDPQSYLNHRLKSGRIWMAYFLIFLAGAIGTTIYLLFQDLSSYRREEYATFVAAAWAGVVFLGGMAWMTRQNSGVRDVFHTNNAFPPEVIKQLTNLPTREEIEQLVSVGRSIQLTGAETLSTQDFEVLREAIKSQIEQKLTADIVHDINGIAGKRAATSMGAETAEGLRKRLSSLASELGVRSAINLMAGVAFAGFGIFLIWQGLDGEPSISLTSDNSTQWLSIAKYYLPRAGMVLLIEILAFFFLRLYRKTLDEIKYVHNELTNVEARILALAHAAQTNNAKLVATCIENLAKTERNFVLKKGETTVDLELSRAESNLARDLIKEGGGIFRRVGSVKE